MSTLTSGGQLPIKQGGQRLPDLVGQLRYTQDWGSFAVQAAAHEFRTAEDVTPRQSKFGSAAGAITKSYSSRRWLPNLQRVRVMVGSAVKRMNVCTRCIRTGKIAKAAR
jgi:large subunit ribosomal protein L28